jgi:hypothetical protein
VEPTSIIQIEPSAADARWLELTLEQCGGDFQVRTFATVADAERELRDRHELCCDLVIVASRPAFYDLKDALAALRRVPCLELARFAIAIVYEHEKAAADVDCCLVKPVDVEQLRAVLALVRRGPERTMGAA